MRPNPSSAIEAGSGIGVVENVFSMTEETAMEPSVRATLAKSLATDKLLTPEKVT